MQERQHVRLIRIPSFTDERGSLAVVGWPESLPFVPQRFYYIYDTAPGVRRAGHAHWQESELILAVSGCVTVVTDEGAARVEHRLDRPDVGLLIPPGAWHELHGFAPGTVCAVFASGHYDAEDYCRDYSEFRDKARERAAARPLP